ncbi:hypothetical protein ACWEKR_17790 [Nocardia sp. NPDC004573]
MPRAATPPAYCSAGPQRHLLFEDLASGWLLPLAVRYAEETTSPPRGRAGDCRNSRSARRDPPALIRAGVTVRWLPTDLTSGLVGAGRWKGASAR